jgi:hypothetical protein
MRIVCDAPVILERAMGIDAVCLIAYTLGLDDAKAYLICAKKVWL